MKWDLTHTGVLSGGDSAWKLVVYTLGSYTSQRYELLFDDRDENLKKCKMSWHLNAWEITEKSQRFGWKTCREEMLWKPRRRYHTTIFLLLFAGWYLTMRPIHCDHYWSVLRPCLSSNNSWFTHQSSLSVTRRDACYRSRRNLVRNVQEFCLQVSRSYCRDF
jgi:hypothetical protein